MARGEQGLQLHSPSGPDRLVGLEGNDRPRSHHRLQPADELGMTAHGGVHDIEHAIEAADMVGVAMGQEDGADPGAPQLLIVGQ